MKYYSKALWPKESGVSDEYGRPESCDTHTTKGQAEAVCSMLCRDGLGGENKFYPLATWVEYSDGDGIRIGRPKWVKSLY